MQRSAPSSPRRVGPYELLGELGRGGMGVVFEARHEVSGQEVAGYAADHLEDENLWRALAAALDGDRRRARQLLPRATSERPRERVVPWRTPVETARLVDAILAGNVEPGPGRATVRRGPPSRYTGVGAGAPAPSSTCVIASTTSRG